MADDLVEGVEERTTARLNLELRPATTDEKGAEYCCAVFGVVRR